jgi:hypothetical protein
VYSYSYLVAPQHCQSPLLSTYKYTKNKPKIKEK